MAKVKQGIVGFSFNNAGNSNKVDAMIKKKAEGYRAKGLNVSHNIERTNYGDVDNLKFNYLLLDVPLVVWTMVNLLHSGLEDIVAVSSDEVKKIIDALRYVHGNLFKDRRVTFVHEGDKLNFYNTLARGRTGLADGKGLTYFHSGDTPFLVDINPILDDPDADDYDIIMDLNARENIFGDSPEIFRRNYYWRFRDRDGRVYSIKEGNVVMMNLDKIDEDMMRFIRGTRKMGGLNYASILPHLIRKGGFLQALVMSPQLLLHSLRRCTNPDFAEKVGRLLFKCDVRLKAQHGDLNRLADIDSYEDWHYYEQVARHAELNRGGLEYIYPHADEVREFRREIMRKNGLDSIPIFKNFRGFINARFETFGLPAPYGESFRFTMSDKQLEAAVDHYHKNLSAAKAESR